ncbi:MAG: sigma-70 family RNA polymerase sigma factor [Burkholderiaceae bacterium]|nr:sigma-70 family RNA polymerase sigma factor [Burkholderiaceae bacterium]
MTAATLAPNRAAAMFAAGLPIDLAAHRLAMLRFARRKIRDDDLAEDAVQDALVAALASRSSFQGRSALRTWLIGILNHKIQDVFRRESRYVRAAPAPDEDPSAGQAPGLVAAAIETSAQDDPAHLVQQRRMHDALLREVEALPRALREVFVMQVIDGRITSEVCAALGITEANCWVRLHRARKRLSERLGDHLR